MTEGAQAAWLRRRRSNTNEPIASPPSAMTGMTKRALCIVPPHCRSGWISVHRCRLTLAIFPARCGLSREHAQLAMSRSSDLVVQVEEGGVELWRPAFIRNDLDAEVAVAVHIERLDGLFESGGGERMKDRFDCHQFIPVRASRNQVAEPRKLHQATRWQVPPRWPESQNESCA
jgi:hypothetical protein